MNNDKVLEIAQLEECLKDLACARVDNDQHVIVIAHNSRERTLAIRFINTEPTLAYSLFRISLDETQPSAETGSQYQSSLH